MIFHQDISSMGSVCQTGGREWCMRPGKKRPGRGQRGTISRGHQPLGSRDTPGTCLAGRGCLKYLIGWLQAYMSNIVLVHGHSPGHATTSCPVPVQAWVPQCAAGYRSVSSGSRCPCFMDTGPGMGGRILWTVVGASKLPQKNWRELAIGRGVAEDGADTPFVAFKTTSCPAPRVWALLKPRSESTGAAT